MTSSPAKMQPRRLRAALVWDAGQTVVKVNRSMHSRQRFTSLVKNEDRHFPVCYFDCAKLTLRVVTDLVHGSGYTAVVTFRVENNAIPPFLKKLKSRQVL